MEPEAEDLEKSNNLTPSSGSDGSQEICASESLTGSYYEDDDSEAENLSAPRSGSESPEGLKLHDWESASNQESPAAHHERDAAVSHQGEDEITICESRESITECPHIQTSPTSLSMYPEPSDSMPHTGHILWQHSQSSSSSLGSSADLTQALTPTTKQPQGTSYRQGPRTRNRRVESSEEGGSGEAPPASVIFGISDEGAEKAATWNSGSDSDLCRPDRHRARYTRLRHTESQSEKRVKETKSKCKHIARLLTDAPNPQNKGALLFKKRRQRVKKYTLVSYGTGVDNEDLIEGETDEVRSARYNFVPTSESEQEDQYSLYHQQRDLSVGWGSVQEMEELPETKGKGVLMFAQRRKRMDKLVSEHEELRSKGSPVEAVSEPQSIRGQNTYEPTEIHVHADEINYSKVNLKKHSECPEDFLQMNHLSNMPKPLVPNRTAKPFQGFQDGSTPAVMPGGVSPIPKTHESRFKVPVPVNTNPKVWSPTGDIIASRDERISVPAIKTCILPESKRKTANKQPSTSAQGTDPNNQRKGDRKSFIESEEDCFSLGAEACNFMQPRTIKLKNPPPVAPKPTIDPSCPPWMRTSPSSEPFLPPRSPAPQPSHSPVGPPSQHYLQQQDWAQPQQMASRWATNQTQATLQTPANAWVPVSSSSQLYPQPTTKSWSQQPSRSPVSMQARSPSYSPHLLPKSKSDNVPNSVASCPPQTGKSYLNTSKGLQASPQGRVSDRGVNQTADGSAMSGKGAQLFAKRQSRMERFVVDAETVQANKRRTPSPTLSLPNSWRYSSNIRAPPPLSYNPLLAPFYPPSAAKQAPSTSPKIKPKTKEKPKSAPKHLNALDIMKHQPYQLDSSLFTYDAASEAKSPSPKPPVSKFEITKSRKQRSASSHSSNDTSDLAVHCKIEAPAKSPGLVSPQTFSVQNARSAEPLATDKHLDEMLVAITAVHHLNGKQAPSTRPPSTSSQHSSIGDSIAAAFSPASLIARGARQMAPRPTFSAKKPLVTGKQWKPVSMLQSI